jgi:hypothetical protein
VHNIFERKVKKWSNSKTIKKIEQTANLASGIKDANFINQKTCWTTGCHIV